MRTITLGLDLGIASIGWAILSEEKEKREIMHWGSRIFAPGMDDDIASGKGVSRCAERRKKRASRLQYKRRKQRKTELINELISIGLLQNRPDNNFFKNIDHRLLK